VAHTHYNGTGKMHSFRGKLADGGQERIRIQGPVGAIAWRITKFELIGPDASESIESTVKIYRMEQTSVDDAIDFTDSNLLGAGVINQSQVSQNYSDDVRIIFDNELFVQNIYVTNKGVDYTASVNYYIELEEVKVSQAGMAQLAVATVRRLS
jgi:hypothetical protein